MSSKDMLTTDVDRFIELVREKKKISMTDAAKALGTTQQTVQAWTDFLVEEKILGIEYNFTTPYIFFNREPDDDLGMSFAGFDSKDDFYAKARKKGIKESQIKLLWLKYIHINKETMKNVFAEKAREKGVPEDTLEALWNRYYEYLEK